MANCSECGAYYRDFDDCMPWQDSEGYSTDCCSKYCFERSWAACMDGYDVDDPNNPAYSNSTASRQPTEVTILNGYHRYTYADGSTYDGEWKDDKKHGQGTKKYAEGYK